MKKLKTFLLVLVVFSLLPLPCWSESSSEEEAEEITWTMKEYQFLKNSVGNLQTIDEQKDKYILTLENSLQQSNSETLKKMILVGTISFSLGVEIGALAACLVYLAN